MDLTDRGTEQGWTIPLADMAATERLASRLADFLKPGDTLTLSGDVGKAAVRAEFI